MQNGLNILPDTLFFCIVPTIATMTELDMEYVGMVNEVWNGEEGDPNTLATTRVKINIDKMINIYEMGFNIRVVDPMDVTTIYHILDSYVAGKDNMGGESLNRPIATDPRIDTIKRFMVAIMEQNQQQIVRYSIGHTPNGFDLGMTGFIENDQRQVSGYNPNTPNRVKRKIIGVGDVPENKLQAGSMYNNVPSIDFNMAEYTKRMKK